MKNTFIMIVVSGLIAGCGVFGSIGNSAGSSAGSSAGGSSAGSSGGRLFQKREKEIVLEQRDDKEDTRVLVPTVRNVSVDLFQGGALIHATGFGNRIGYAKPHLQPLNRGLPDENGVVTYEFIAEPPAQNIPAPTERSGEILAANSISSVVLPNVRVIRVVASNNEITVANR